MLDANQLNIEHRYFGTSLPEPFEDLSMTYLHADQQAQDIHRIISTMKTHLFKTSKWVSTGVSKDGITTALQAYYSDLNGWDDVDAYVPFCAPFLPGTTYSDGSFSYNSPIVGTYIKDVCGNGYEAGSTEAIAYERLKKIPQLICTNTNIRDKAINAAFRAYPTHYSRILEQYSSGSNMSTGNLNKDQAAFAIFAYYEGLFSKFSYVPYAAWAWLVPDLTPLENNTATEDEWDFFMDFFTMNNEALTLYLEDHPKPEGNTAKAATRSASEQLWTFLKNRREDKTAPYEIQAFMELGAPVTDYSLVDGTGYLTDLQCQRVNYMFTNQAKYEEAAAMGYYPQDKGQLMTNFHTWAATETTQPIMFVYAYNDPWTGGAISDATAQNNQMIEKVVDVIATHNEFFLQRYYYTQETENKIRSFVEKYLK